MKVSTSYDNYQLSRPDSDVQFLRSSWGNKEGLMHMQRAVIGLEGQLGFEWGGKKKAFKMKEIQNEF